MTRTDFEIVRAGSSAYPWAVRHKESGDLLSYRANVKTAWAGEFQTTLLFHRLKREATAALESYLAEQDHLGRPPGGKSLSA